MAQCWARRKFFKQPLAEPPPLGDVYLIIPDTPLWLSQRLCAILNSYRILSATFITSKSPSFDIVNYARFFTDIALPYCAFSPTYRYSM